VKRYLIGVSAALLFAFVAFMAFVAWPAWHKFSVEDRIHGAFYPVVNALYTFQQDTGVPAADLAQLTPKYLTAIPQSELVAGVSYLRSSDGKAWTLSLSSTALAPPRIYCCRSDGKYTTEEEQRVIQRYHGTWVVLRK
jgi:hypothetical protein